MKIGLTFTGNDEKHNNYVTWLRGDDDIEIIKLSAENRNDEMVRNIDALVLSGGIDSHPRFYNGNIEYPGKPENGWNELRDEYELSLLENALNRSIPVLGICRGLQLINIYKGGTLFQDLLEKEIGHRTINTKDQQHTIKIQENTLLSEITGITSDVVNSAHHQSIKTMGEDLMENCRSADNVIEGIEWKDKSNKPFMLAVQWHPERMKNLGLGNSPLSKNIRECFIKEINKNSNK
ncbi:MAG: gamma-glutamyl-gamma-aminobutyrate hydrolase family protein [Flavitalea sp.]